jgi:hypothetical protein
MNQDHPDKPDQSAQEVMVKHSRPPTLFVVNFTKVDQFVTLSLENYAVSFSR